MPTNSRLAQAPAAHKEVLKLMGNRFEITVVEKNPERAKEHIAAAVEEIRRIESLFTTYTEESQTALINRFAGVKPVKVDREVFDLIQRSKRISEITQGAFDITYGSIDKRLWNFDQQMTSLPDAATAKEMVRLINYRNILLDEKKGTVFLKEKGMRIGFGGIGKGYAAEMAKAVLQQRGVQSGVVNAAGDLTVWGYQPDEKPWTIGIADPASARQPFSYVELTNMSVATSGNYEKYALIDGKRYSHTIDPKTGLPVHGIKSVTIISPNAEIADAMATPVMIMGVKVGLDLINQIRGLSCIIIDEENRLFTSNNIKILQ
ncbi:FAD:protein FMN transferase [Flavisolibacter nicotianae]|uniref:FAD:protein FMN transferase n=1 Tax=Flavisolibacter nicotianae TaxID=2364882 RepID=UPI000EAF7BAA|nr:FAD:protein FMN transferase [Flavisolibacter nicotianae]